MQVSMSGKRTLEQRYLCRNHMQSVQRANIAARVQGFIFWNLAYVLYSVSVPARGSLLLLPPSSGTLSSLPHCINWLLNYFEWKVFSEVNKNIPVYSKERTEELCALFCFVKTRYPKSFMCSVFLVHIVIQPSMSRVYWYLNAVWLLNQNVKIFTVIQHINDTARSSSLFKTSKCIFNEVEVQTLQRSLFCSGSSFGWTTHRQIFKKMV